MKEIAVLIRRKMAIVATMVDIPDSRMSVDSSAHSPAANGVAVEAVARAADIKMVNTLNSRTAMFPAPKTLQHSRCARRQHSTPSNMHSSLPRHHRPVATEMAIGHSP